jgi:hypothetical protein
VDVLHHASDRISSAAELYGAVQQEARYDPIILAAMFLSRTSGTNVMIRRKAFAKKVLEKNGNLAQNSASIYKN